MSEIVFKIEDMSPQVKEQLDVAIEKALYASGVAIQEGATRAISGQYDPSLRAVDTGRLRASISFITSQAKSPIPQDAPKELKLDDMLSGRADKNSVIYGTNVEYATFVENGTSRMTGRPFLRTGVDMKKGEIVKTIEKIFKGEL